jgi:hypothetical protein
MKLDVLFNVLKERIPDNYDSRYARDILGDEEICVSC